MRSIVTFAGIMILSWVVGFIGTSLLFVSGMLCPLFWPLSGLIGIAGVILWIIPMFKAYPGEKFKLPIVGDMAEKYA